jgi:biofilm PGA synthesis protein PgaA
LGGGAQLFSRDIPLRALKAGITANSYNVNADWFQSHVRNVRMDADFMTFSDDNVRSALSATDREHLYASKAFGFDGLLGLAGSQNSKDEYRPYFNPRADAQGTIGGQLTQPLYQTDTITYDHHLEVKPGVYWQQYYGSSPAITADYGQHVNYANVLDTSLDVIFNRQDSDGAPENSMTLLLNMSKTF